MATSRPAGPSGPNGSCPHRWNSGGPNTIVSTCSSPVASWMKLTENACSPRGMFDGAAVITWSVGGGTVAASACTGRGGSAAGAGVGRTSAREGVSAMRLFAYSTAASALDWGMGITSFLGSDTLGAFQPGSDWPIGLVKCVGDDVW